MENTSTETMVPRKFTIKERFYWGFASLGGSIISGIYASLLPIFYTDYLGLVESAGIIYVVSIIYAIWNAINDPLFGVISDKTKSKKGRRIPFMRYTAPFLGLFFILVWFADPSFSEMQLFWWMLITMLLYDTAYTIIFLVFSALLPEITEDEKERNGLQVISSFLSLIGTIFGFIIPDLFRHQASLLPLRMSMIAVGIIGSTLIIFTTYKFKERPEFTIVDEPLGMIDMIKFTFKSKSFIIVVIANFMSILLQSLILGSLFYLGDYVTQTSSIILTLFVFIPLIVGIWITPKLIDKFDVVRADQLLLILGGIGLIMLTFMPTNELIFVSIAIAGFGFVGPLVFTNLLFAQVADEDEIRTGVRREAMFFGVNALITKPAQSIALAIPVALLAATGFIPRSQTGGIARPDLQPVAALFSIRLFIGLIPGIALLLEVLILQFYPLKGEYWAKIKEEILKLHDEKHKKLQEMMKNQK
ncbi:MAG: MFS transporter [Promethearchaeota archaeon]